MDCKPPTSYISHLASPIARLTRGRSQCRVFGAVIRHRIRTRRPLPPKALFHYSVTSTYNALLETDYNFHKSNSTYFADLDISRSHLAMHLLSPGVKVLENNKRTKVVCDKDGKPVGGTFGLGLGAVFCSFKKEIAPYQGYELWTRVLSWDRKWFYMVSHFVVKGKVRPTSWDGGSSWGQSGRLRTAEVDEADLQKYVIATAVSKYVFKMGRFTVHPTYLMEQSGLLPERPGEGWRGDETDAATPDELGDIDKAGEWDWRHVEHERRAGMEFTKHFAALDGAHGLFDGGSDGALGRFSPG